MRKIVAWSVGLVIRDRGCDDERMNIDRAILAKNHVQYSSSADENSWSVRMLFLIHSVYMGTLTYTPGRLGVAHSTPQLTMPPTNHRSLYPSIGHSSGPPESPCWEITCILYIRCHSTYFVHDYGRHINIILVINLYPLYRHTVRHDNRIEREERYIGHYSSVIIAFFECTIYIILVITHSAHFNTRQPLRSYNFYVFFSVI